MHHLELPGVPLFREYLTDSEMAGKVKPQIRMMGQATAQRSTLSLNFGSYYIDTTQNCTSQGGCPKCIKLNKDDPSKCDTYDSNPFRPSIFLGGHTYYVYFLFATDKTNRNTTFMLALGLSLAELNVKAVRVDPNNYSTPTASDGSYIYLKYPTGPNGSIFAGSGDLTGQTSAFTKSKPLFCRPQSYCSTKADGSCGCKAGSGCVKDSDCAGAERHGLPG